MAEEGLKGVDVMADRDVMDAAADDLFRRMRRCQELQNELRGASEDAYTSLLQYASLDRGTFGEVRSEVGSALVEDKFSFAIGIFNRYRINLLELRVGTPTVEEGWGLMRKKEWVVWNSDVFGEDTAEDGQIVEARNPGGGSQEAKSKFMSRRAELGRPDRMECRARGEHRCSGHSEGLGGA